jgi:amino-acid N-acetyltransferase
VKSLVTIREAVESDIEKIHELLTIYSKQAIVLERSEEDIRFYLGNFLVAEVGGVVRGCAAARDFGNDLLEVRSMVVEPEFQGKGIGRAMVEALIAGLRVRRPKFRLFSLTYQVKFFQSLGFKVVDRRLFPEKIWSDCAKCPKNQCCDETALLIEYPSQENI